jgi:hypothetical protein
MTNKYKALTQEQCALLKTVEAKPFEGKPLRQTVANRYKTDAEASVAWSRLKSECVLLKKAR